MAIKTYRPMTPSRRAITTLKNEDITTDKPFKALTVGKRKTGGRRNAGDVTSWWRGGGHKRKLRAIDFKRDKAGIPAKVVSIEYDPNRSARIALLSYADGEHRYILQPNGLQVLVDCMATIGQVGNLDHENVAIGKAGRTRWMGKRPHNRGVSMNPVDHPHGGGEGKTSGGRHPVTPWGQPTRGYKTRNNKRTEKFIISRSQK
jgi:large subunit ribosomal protein L2